MTCEVYEYRLTGLCMKCKQRYEECHVHGMEYEGPLVLLCPQCCEEHNPPVREPGFGEVAEKIQEELFHE